VNIYLIRHGETEWNKEGRLQGRTDIKLNQTGKTQMQSVAEVLEKLEEDMDLIISSPLLRARESAEIIAKELTYKIGNILVEPLLIERSFGVGEGLREEERVQKYPGDNYPDMESFDDLISRGLMAFNKIVNSSCDKQNVLVVAHGAILYAMLTAVTEGIIEYGGRMVKFDQGSIYRIAYQEKSFELSKYNEENRDFQLVYTNI